jgi:fatty-acyl-CoA synthase
MRNSEEDIILGHMPLNHVGGISCSILSAMHFGSTVILIPAFVPELVLDAIQRYRATIFAGVPTMYLMLFNSNFEKYDVSSLRLVVIGGSNAQPELLKRIKAGFPNATVMNLYGLTESSGACICSPLDDSFEDILDSIGVPIGDYEVMIVDEKGQPLPDGEVGEIAIKGDCVCSGYIGLEEKTKESFRNGWLFTGDMAYKRGNRIYFMGRKKEMYIQAGFNVYPAEIENVLIKHPKVFMVAVIGVPDEFYGEKGVAYVVPKGEVSEEELKEYCARYLADYKVPKEFIFEETLPLTPAGKIQKSELLKMYMERKSA